MAGSADNILIGAATVLVYAWATSLPDMTDPSMTDIGYTNGPVEWGGSVETYECDVEQSFFPVQSVLTKATMTLKIPFAEPTLTNIAKWYSHSYTSGALTIAQPSDLYWQILFKAKGPTATPVRRYRFYKCRIQPPSALQLTKGKEAAGEVTIQALYDTSLTTPALAKIADAAS